MTAGFVGFLTAALGVVLIGAFEVGFEGALGFAFAATLTAFLATGWGAFTPFLTAWAGTAFLAGAAFTGVERALGFALDFFILSPQRGGQRQLGLGATDSYHPNKIT